MLENHNLLWLLLSLVIFSAISLGEAKQRSRFVSAEMRRIALENIRKFDWAQKEQADALLAAKLWVEMSDNELWALITSQELPRDVHTNKEIGCPNCGEGIAPYGNYPWKFDFRNRPWKLECPNCHEIFPKNDFFAFYKTALDEKGMFRRNLGDRSLLFNTDHPDPDDPLHKLYADDGYGMFDENGRKHRIIAYYTQWAHWQSIQQGLTALAAAFSLTDEVRYAHKAAVLLDRIADVYPEMDFMPLHKMGFEHSHGGPGRGRIQGSIWECGAAEAMARNYDLIFDGIQQDTELVQFCHQKAKEFHAGDKQNIDAICKHIENDLLFEFVKSVKDWRIDGNQGMAQNAMAVTAIALDRPGTTESLLDWLFEPDAGRRGIDQQKGGVPWVLVEGIDREGMGAESGNYGLIWTRKFIELAEVLKYYPEYTRHNLIKEFPKLRQCFLIEHRLLCLDSALPPIGDTGAPGLWSQAGDPKRLALGFDLLGDPEMATMAWRRANGDLEQLRGSIFEPDPMRRAGKIAAIAGQNQFKLKSLHLGGYGLAILQTESVENGRALWLYHSQTRGHYHNDRLNIGLYAKNVDVLPDLGYPEYTGPWPKRVGWTKQTISHNTLVVNATKQSGARAGKVNLFSIEPPVRLVDVSANDTYPGMKTYRRLVALVDISDDDSYVFDVFRARGGNNHRLSYHGPGQSVETAGLDLTGQIKGTFAGENIEFAQFYDDESGWNYSGSGFMYLYDVERAKGISDGGFIVDWKAEDKRGRILAGHEPHLRLHSLSTCDEIALASGDPPQNKPGNPRRLRYLIQSRLGENVESQFITILEPYDSQPIIKNVRKLNVTGSDDPNAVAAVEVELQDGRTDILISCEEPLKVTVEGGVEFDGQFGWIRLQNGRVKSMRMTRARILKFDDVSLTCDVPAYEGLVKAIDAENPADNRIVLEPPLPALPELIGKTIVFRNDHQKDTSFEIKRIHGNSISTGDITIIAGFKTAQDYDSGFTYLVNPGDPYIVACSKSFDAY